MMNFKKNIILEVFKNFDRVYMHIAPLKEVIIGDRGFVDREKEDGIVLVFRQESYKDFEWDDDKIYVSMRFSGKWENLEIPLNAIQAVFNDPLMPNFIFNFKVFVPEKKHDKTEEKENIGIKKNGNVISVNFGKKDN